MGLYKIARICFWSAVLGSFTILILINYGSSLNPELLRAEHLEQISKVWNFINPILVGGGAVSVREVVEIDSSMNGNWYWVSQVTDDKDKDRLLRVATGKIEINNIDDLNKRISEPQKVISGRATNINDIESDTGGNIFWATEILVARNKTIVYHWEYQDSHHAAGWTMISYHRGLRNWFFGRAEDVINGRFCMITENGSGSIRFFRNANTALEVYQDALSNYKKLG